MEGSTAEVVYLICFFLGLGFAVLSFMFGEVFHAALQHGDGGLGGGPHLDTDGGMHFPILSPVTIATFVGSFGGIGVIVLKTQPEWGTLAHTSIAAGGGLLVTGLVLLIMYKLFGNVEGSSAPREVDLIGLESQVTVSIPKNGAGQIRYMAGGAYFTGVARNEDNEEIHQGENVKILKIVGGVFFVRRFQRV